MDNDYINSKIIDVWKRYPKESGERWPILYPEFNGVGVLFIGLNPSFSDKAFKTIFKGTKYENEDIKKLIRGDENFNPEICDFLIQFEKKANEKNAYPYFKRFYKISEELGLPHQHIDLFYFRDTTQNEAKKRVGEYDKNGKFVLNRFGESQVKIALEIIPEISPKVIVVVNAFASDIINDCGLFRVNNNTFEENG